MVYGRLISSCIILLYTGIYSAVLNPSTSPELLSLNLLAFNLTLPTPPKHLSAPKTGITCFSTSSRTTVAGCRVALNYFKDFPNYKVVQPFQRDRCPVILNGQKPPLLIFAKEANCAIEIAVKEEVGQRPIVDAFSFEEVRQLATEIVEDCQDAGGHGGWSAIGREIGWHVRVIGVNSGEVGSKVGGMMVVEGNATLEREH